MALNIYLSGEIHTDWREQIIAGAKGLDVVFSSPVTDHAASDDCGVAILGAVDGQRTLAGVIEKLAKDFNAPEERIAKDAGRFLEDLIGRRMVEVKG